MWLVQECERSVKAVICVSFLKLINYFINRAILYRILIVYSFFIAYAEVLNRNST